MLHERAVWARDRHKLEYGMMSRAQLCSPTAAYRATLAECGPRACERVDVDRFRRLLDVAYTPDGSSAAFDPPCRGPNYPQHLWCPVTQRWHDEQCVRRAHIVPPAIGEFNAAYVFGLDPDQGWGALWGFENGILLYRDIADALSAGQIVIVPDGDGNGDGNDGDDDGDENTAEFKLVVLDESILNYHLCGDGLTYRDLHLSRLRFKTANWPGKRYLYFRCLVIFLRRHRLGLDRPDSADLNAGKAVLDAFWPTPNNYVRASLIEALALEIGDYRHREYLQDGLTSGEPYPYQATPAKEYDIAVDLRHVLESRIPNEHSDQD